MNQRLEMPVGKGVRVVECILLRLYDYVARSSWQPIYRVKIFHAQSVDRCEQIITTYVSDICKVYLGLNQAASRGSYPLMIAQPG
jgi:hypothetical protein